MHMMLTSKKGISALQIYRVMGFGSYNTAHLMCSKIRVALGNVEFKQLIGYVEVDETYVGGKAKNKAQGTGRTRRHGRHWRNRQIHRSRRSAAQGQCCRARHRQNRCQDVG